MWIKGPWQIEITGNYLNGVKNTDRRESKVLPGFTTRMRPEGCCCLSQKGAIGEKGQFGGRGAVPSARGALLGLSQLRGCVYSWIAYLCTVAQNGPLGS